MTTAGGFELEFDSILDPDFRRDDSVIGVSGVPEQLPQNTGFTKRHLLAILALETF